jgi:hypothetical protein
MVKAASCGLKDVLAVGALPMYTKINGKEVLLGMLTGKQFSTGSYGFGLNGKANIPLNDGAVASVQMSCNLTVIGSKNASAEQLAVEPATESEAEAA